MDIIRKVLKRISRYWGYLVLSVLSAMLTVVATLYVPTRIGNAIDLMLGANQVQFGGIIRILIQIAVIVGLASISQWVMNICNNKITYHVTRDIRDEAIEKIEILPLSYIDSHSYGEVVSRVIADVDQFADGLLMGFTQFFTGILTILGTLLFMLLIDYRITLVVVLITPLSLFVASTIAKRTYKMFRLQSETRGEQTAIIDEMIGGQKVVQAYNHEAEALDEFDAVNRRLQKYSLRAIFFSSITNPATRFVNSLVYAGVAVTGAIIAIHGGISVGQLSCFLSYANQYTKPFNEISGVAAELQNAIACAGRIFELIEAEPESSDVLHADDQAMKQTMNQTMNQTTNQAMNQATNQIMKQDETLDLATGTVDLSHVTFAYDESTSLIKDLNLHVEKGQRIAIVGPTGCGKTTLINLLMRFYDVNGGTITVDGTDIRAMTRHALRARYGMVLQDTWLKAGTIRENIIMGKPDANDQEIIQAAKAAHAYDFIRRMPKGLDTVMEEDGGGLSQGQKQLLCITRVMLCHPPMLILDEATSSIDTRTELKIQDAFAKLMAGRTTFIVAHRLSTIQSADVILVMKNGRILEQGRHEELMQKHGFYQHLYQSQFEQ